MRTVSVLLVLICCALLSGCGSQGSGYTPAVIPAISGQWEFVASSTSSPGLQTNIEANVQEGQQLVQGMNVPDGQLTAAGSQQIAILTVDTAGNARFSGSCAGSGSSGLTGTVDQNYNVKMTYNENGNAFNVSGSLSSDHKTILGTYSAQAGSGCSDSGMLVGTAVSKIGGTYVGALCPPAVTSCVYPQEASDNATMAASQSGSTLKLSFVLTGTDNTGLALSGPVIGNSFIVQGTFQGQVVTYYGYYELTFDCLTQQIDLPSIYLVNPSYIDVGNTFGAAALLSAPLSQGCSAR